MNYSHLGAFHHLIESSDTLRCVQKDLEHRYVYVNPAWMKCFGHTPQSALNLIGKTAWDLFPKWRARRYIREEKEVMEKEITMDYQEYTLNAEGVLEAWRTYKNPWYKNDKVAGYINLGMKLDDPIETRQDKIPKELSELIKTMNSDLTIKELAESMGVSRRTYERKFREFTDESPQKFRQRYQIIKAKNLLKQGHKIIEVASKCGFSDQSYFIKIFKRYETLTPKKYQSEHLNES